MAVVKKVELQDHEGNIVHPHTEAVLVFLSDGGTIESILSDGVTEEDIRAIIEEEE